MSAVRDQSQQETSVSRASSVPATTVTVQASPGGILSATRVAILVTSTVAASLIVLASCCFCFHRLDRRRARRSAAISEANAAVEGEQDALNELDRREIHHCDPRDVFEADSEQRVVVKGEVPHDTRAEKAEDRDQLVAGREGEGSGAASSTKNEASLQGKTVT
jgi:hypothetical protein